MPVPTIFLVTDSGEFAELADRPYDSERLLQELLARYPGVLASDRIDGGARAKWLLVEREAGIPGESGGADRWSLDHVFIDRNAIPTLVEVKRSSDSRIRREVVGQMLDYAANAVLHWPPGAVRQRFEQTCRDTGSDPGGVIAEFIGCDGVNDPDTAVAGFWEAVETNLRAGKVRLIFAADEIPPELRRVVEFLNEQMNPAEVLAVEIRQYVGPGVRTLVPSVIGAKRRAVPAAAQRSAQWDRESFLAALGERSGERAVQIAVRMLDWAARHAPNFWWGEGRKDGSCFPGFSHGGVRYFFFSLWTYGRVELQFQWLRNKPLPPGLLEETAARLNLIRGIAVAPEALGKRPSFDIRILEDPAALDAFLETVAWFAEQVRAQ